MDIKITQQQLVTTNLKYSAMAKSLKSLAFADLSAKALFLSGGNKNLKGIAKEVAKIIGIDNVSQDLIKNGLKELISDRRVVERGNYYDLVKRERQKISDEVTLSESKLEAIIDGHFPHNIEKDKIIAWFNDALVDFFEYNGDEWVQSICKKTKKIYNKPKSIDDIINKSIIKHNLDDYSKDLKNSFRAIIVSEDIKDQSYIADVGYAMFSARLVAADIGADPIALDELRGGNFLLDTNFIVALQLDSHKFAASMEALGKALKNIGAKLTYIRETEAEYNRVIVGRRGDVRNLLNVYPEKTVMEVGDDFVKAAVARGCKNAEDFENFYNDISFIPTEIPFGPKIEPLDFSDIDAEVEKAKKDNALKILINNWCLKLRPIWWRPKSKAAIEHDAALIYAAEFERKSGRKTFILTLDRGLQSCCLERAGSHSVPFGIYLEGLLQILAAYNSGPEIDATNFAPLLSNILQKRCIPEEKTYSLLDLHWLYGIQKNISKFSPDKIKNIVLEVTRSRLSGKDETDEKLQRTINRLYQDELQTSSKEIEEMASRVLKAESVAETEIQRRTILEEKIVQNEKTEKIRNLRKKLLVSCLWRIPLSLILAFLVYRLIKLAIPEDSKDLLAFILNIIQVSIILFSFLKKPLKLLQEYNKQIIENKK